MSFVMFLIVGLSTGIVVETITIQRFPFGTALTLALSLLIGLTAAFAGGILGNAIAGHSLGLITPASAGGTGLAGLATVALVATLVHWRHTRARQRPLPPTPDDSRERRVGMHSLRRGPYRTAA